MFSNHDWPLPFTNYVQRELESGFSKLSRSEFYTELSQGIERKSNEKKSNGKLDSNMVDRA